jgi:hypothetical protein
VRVLLDECTPRRLRHDIPGHDVKTVVEMGWGGTRNGALLARAATEFDVLLRVDSNMEFQQNLATLPLAVIALVAYRNDIDVLRSLMPQVRELLPVIEPGRLYRIGPPE